MEEAAEAVSDSPSEPSTEPENVSRETSSEPVANNNDKPEGWDRIDFTNATPEQIEKRFSRLYGQTKTLQRDIGQYKSIAQQQFDLINELQQGHHQIVSHIQNDDFSRAENQIKTQRDEAFQRGDMQGFNAANDRLIQINTQRAVADLQKQNQPKQNTQPQQNEAYIQVNDVNDAVSKGVISHADASVYDSWSNQTDTYGEPLRPWVNKSDPRFQVAELEGQAVFNNPAFRNKSMAEKLSEVDRRMGINSRQPSQAVLGSGANLTRGKQQSNIKLSPFAEKLAVKTKFAGPGKSEAEHLEAYRQQIFKTRGSK